MHIHDIPSLYYISRHGESHHHHFHKYRLNDSPSKENILKFVKSYRAGELKRHYHSQNIESLARFEGLINVVNADQLARLFTPSSQEKYIVLYLFKEYSPYHKGVCVC